MYLLLCPCINDPSLRAIGITNEDDLIAYKKVRERCRIFNIPVNYLPCNETIYLGKERQPGYYTNRLDNDEFTRILLSSEEKVRTLIKKEGFPFAIIGVDSSPVCGVNRSWYGGFDSVPVKLAQRGCFLSRFLDIPAYDVYDAACFKVYLAAPLFSEAERDFNKKLAKILSGYAMEVYLPQETGDTDITRSHEDIKSIFEDNLRYLEEADLVVAVLEGSDADSGTSWEMGYAYAKNKKILSLRTDFREVGRQETVNLMLEQSSNVSRDIPSLISLIPCPINLNQQDQ
jgi:nucleoside 2-deoxyribosyltransferase/predicted secreted protein